MPVYDSAPGMPRPGVGSNGTHPIAAPNHSSGQAWAFLPSTPYQLSGALQPGVNPTATRDGMFSVRAIAANVAENCSQYPTRSMRKLSIADVP